MERNQILKLFWQKQTVFTNAVREEKKRRSFLPYVDSSHGCNLKAHLSFIKILFATLSLQGDPGGAEGPQGPPGHKGEPGEPGGGYMVGTIKLRLTFVLMCKEKKNKERKSSAKEV